MLVGRRVCNDFSFFMINQDTLFIFFCFNLFFVIPAILGIQAHNVPMFLISLMLLIVNGVECIIGVLAQEVKAFDESNKSSLVLNMYNVLKDMNRIVASILYDFRVLHSFTLIVDELGFWMLSRSTLWFLGFMMHEYDDWWWLENFRMSKQGQLTLVGILCPHLQKKNTCSAKPSLS